MNVYAWHYFNLSMDNTNRCHIYLFSFREVQLFKKGSHIMSKLIIIIIIIRLFKLSTIRSHHIASIMCPDILCSYHIYVAAVYLCNAGDIKCAEKSRPS